MEMQRLAASLASAPAALAKSGSVTGAYADMCGRHTFTFLVLLGAVAAGKAVKIELLGANDAGGSGAETVAETTYTAPAAGVTGHMAVVRGRVTPAWRYMAVKVSNLDTETDTTAAAALVSGALHVPQADGATVLEV